MFSKDPAREEDASYQDVRRLLKREDLLDFETPSARLLERTLASIRIAKEPSRLARTLKGVWRRIREGILRMTVR